MGSWILNTDDDWGNAPVVNIEDRKIEIIKEYFKKEGTEADAKVSYEEYYKPNGLYWTIKYAHGHGIDLFTLDEWNHLHMATGVNTIPITDLWKVFEIMEEETGDCHIMDYDYDDELNRTLICSWYQKVLDNKEAKNG